MAGGLKILSVNQEKELYDTPRYSKEEQNINFEIGEDIQCLLSNFSSVQSKIFFILQLGYFRSKAMFWSTNKLLKNTGDLTFICTKYFPTAYRNFANYKLPDNNRLLQQKIILEMFGYHRLGVNNSSLLQEELQRLVKINVRPIYILGAVVQFLESNRILLPGYSVLQNMIGKYIQKENLRLQDAILELLSTEQVQQIDQLIYERTSFFHSLTLLKRDPKNFSHNQIKELVKQKESIAKFNLHKFDLEEVLNISWQNINYYGRLIDYYSMHDIKTMKRGNAYFLIYCFLYTKYRRINDYLVQMFLYRMRKYKKEAKTEASKILANNQQVELDSKRLGKILNLFFDDKIADDIPFAEVRSKTFSILKKEELRRMQQTLSSDKLNVKYYEWQLWDQLARKVKMNIRPIIGQLMFGATSDNSFVEAIKYLQTQVLDKQPILHESFADWIPTNNLKYILVDGKLDMNRLEILIYLKLAEHLESGDIYIPDSISYRSIEDDLLSTKEWENKEKICDSLVIKCDISSPISLLEEIGSEVDYLFHSVNQRIESGDNNHIVLSSRKTRKWTLPYFRLDNEVNSHNFIDELPSINLHTLMKLVNDKCLFTNQFTHILGRYSKGEMNVSNLLGTILAIGTNAGLGKMARISNLSYDQLQSNYQNYIRPTTLKDACDAIIEGISQISAFKEWNIEGDKIYSSSDGQKLETNKDTANARHSSKYFGLGKGVVSYTLSANYLPLSAKIIGANEYEGHYVLDLLLNNTSEIHPHIHTTDTHGSNKVNFALLYLFGYQFAPRYKNIYEVAKTLYSYKKLEIDSENVLQPVRNINIKLIEQEWDSIMRIIASLAKQTISQHTLIRKLSAYPRKNNTQRALHELDKLLKTRYLLKYIDQLDFRQNIHKALNRGESFHSLKKALFYNDEGKFKVKSEYEQLIWAEATRLLSLCVIYYNTFIFNSLSNRLKEIGQDSSPLFSYSPIRWKHIDWFGRFHFEKENDMQEIENVLKAIDNLSFD